MRMSTCTTMIAASVLALMGCGSSDGDNPDQEALSTVEAAYDAFNAGDVETWIEIRDRGSWHETDEDREAVLAAMGDQNTALVAAGARYEDIQCESLGDGEWPVADEGPVSGYSFTCDTNLVDDEGTVYSEAFEWVVRDGEVVAVRSDR